MKERREENNTQDGKRVKKKRIEESKRTKKKQKQTKQNKNSENKMMLPKLRLTTQTDKNLTAIKN
jgi:hypothetical protein